MRFSTAKYTPEQKALGGVLAVIGSSGKVEYYRGLIDPADKKEVEQLAEPEQEARAAPSAADGEGDRNSWIISSRSTTAAAALPNPAKEAGLTPSLAEDLQYVRTNLLRSRLAEEPEVARDLLTYELAVQLLSDDFERGALHLNGNWTETSPHFPEREEQKKAEFAACNLGEAMLELSAQNLCTRHKEWIAPDDNTGTATRFETFQGLDQESKDRILACCVALMVLPQLAFDSDRSLPLEVVAEAISPTWELPRWTRPVLWDRLSKTTLLDILRSTAGPELAKDHRGDKKGDLAAFVAGLFEDPEAGDLPSGSLGAVKAWSPPGFYPDASTNQEDDE